MSIKEFMDQSKGNYVSTKTCQVNDTLTIMSAPTIDKESFPGKVGLVMDVRLDRTNDAMKLRLNGTQVASMEPALGDDAAKWISRRIKIVAKVEYPGLAKSGFIYTVI